MAKDAQNPEEDQQQPETATVIDTPVVVTTVENENVFLITTFGGKRPYNVTDPEKRNFGQFYRSFAYLGRSFTLNSEDKFCKDFDEENIEILKLTESTQSDKGWDYLGHVTITQMDRQHKSKTNRAFYTVANLKSLKTLTNPEDFA
jgi:hypothetical protein